MAGRGRTLVVALSLLAAGAYGGYLFLRTELGVGSSWTDGRRDFGVLSETGIRYAVWDDPRPLPLALDEELRTSRPALSPDGRLLVFAVGERGLNADLWVAEREGEGFGSPRPLFELNSAADELAPAFGSDALYFATDRSGPAYGLDLWRAELDEAGTLGEPHPLGTGVNTRADETDPCPLPGGRALALASNRERGVRTDFDLFLAVAEEPTPPRGGRANPAADDGAAAYRVEPLEALNSPFDEREPGSSADGNALYFASDRAGSRGGFDLYRSFREDTRWLAPEPLHDLNTARTERGPLPSPDGFSLLYEEVDTETGLTGLLRARSLELFRRPPPPLAWQEVLLLLALFVLAALAFLARRWKTLDVVYKCFLVSLLAHLVVLWYLREVYPDSEPFRMQGDDRTFQVRLAPSSTNTPASLRERAGALEARQEVSEETVLPERADPAGELAAARPERRALERLQRAETTPARAPAELAARPADARAAERRLAEREPEPVRLVAVAPSLALGDVRREARRVASSAAEPERTRVEPEATGAPAPERLELVATPRGADLDPGAPEARPLEPVRERQLEDTAVLLPRETFEIHADAAPTLALPAVAREETPERLASAAVRREVERPTAEPLGAGPEARDPLALAAAPVRRESLPPAVPLRLPRATPDAPDAVHLSERDPRDPDPIAVAEAPALALPETRAVELPTRESSRPTREAPLPPPRLASTPEAPRASAALPAPSRTETREDLPERRPDLLHRTEVAVAQELASREATETPSVEEPVAPRPFDALARVRLPEPARERRERERPEPPRRAGLAPGLLADVAPTARPLVAAAPPVAADDAVGAPRSRRLEATPYKNRFGDEKLRALEEFGGGVETERAVAAGLAYLVSIQGSNGAWGSTRDFHDKYGDVRVGKTGLALLAFLGAGHVPDGGTEHVATVERAIDFLLRQQDRRTGHFGDASAYSHGIAAYALAECYALTRDEELRGPLERAVAQILANQSDRDDERFHGGWGYYYPDGRVWSGDRWPRVSVTAWQVMALESARLGGLRVPDRAFEAAREFLVRAWDPRHGAFRYDHDPDRLRSGYPILPASTPAALFGLSLLGIDVSARELAAARDFVLERSPRGYRYDGDDAFVHQARGNLYFWYYGTLSMFRAGGPAWKRWNVAMKDTLLDGQNGDGSWDPISIYCDYAGDDSGDRSYATAMCVLTLEVYYRYFTPLLEVR